MNLFLLLIKYRNYLLASVALLALAAGGYIALIRLADERCVGIEDTSRVIALEKEITSLRASQAKKTTIRKEVVYVTKDIKAGELPSYTSAVLDCLREQASGNKKCVQSSSSAGRQ